MKKIVLYIFLIIGIVFVMIAGIFTYGFVSNGIYRQRRGVISCGGWSNKKCPTGMDCMSYSPHDNENAVGQCVKLDAGIR